MSLEATGNARPGAVPTDDEPPPAGETAGATKATEADETAAEANETAADQVELAWAGDDPGELDPYELPEGVEPADLEGLDGLDGLDEQAYEAEPDDGYDEPGPRHRRRGVLLVTMFTVAALAIVGGAIGAVGALTHGFKKPVTVKYHESAVFKLQTGDCVSSPDGQVVSVLPCSTPHQAEVFATFALPASAWPGAVQVQSEASSGCASRLSGYLNPQLAISLAQSYVFPNQVAWTAGTRTVICEVRAASGQLTESVRGGSLPSFVTQC